MNEAFQINLAKWVAETLKHYKQEVTLTPGPNKRLSMLEHMNDALNLLSHPIIMENLTEDESALLGQYIIEQKRWVNDMVYDQL